MSVEAERLRQTLPDGGEGLLHATQRRDREELYSLLSARSPGAASRVKALERAIALREQWFALLTQRRRRPLTEG